MARIIEKRRSLHKRLACEQQQIEQLNREVNQLQGLAGIGTATCMIAHEINNLLTPLSSYAALALDNPDDRALAEKVFQKTLRNCRRASKVMESMLALADGGTQEKQYRGLNALVEEIFNCLVRDFAKDGITVKTEIPEGLKVWAVGVQIQQVLMNLILNAREAMLPGGGVLTIKAEDSPEATRLAVADTGCGIEPTQLKRIFEPFFSTKTTRESQSQKVSSGLGLAFCKRAIEAHRGSISVESEPQRGTTFKIILPKPQSGKN